jgi:TRAP-type C4-dicarboxylate transport system permease small subunit
MALDKAVTRLAALIAAITGLLFLALFFVNVFNIGVRYLFGIGYVWIPDLSRILFVWMVFLGGSAAYINRQHLLIDFVTARLHGWSASASRPLIDAVMAVFFVLLIITGFRITQARMRIPYDSWEVVPMAVGYAAVPVSALIMLLATLSRLRLWLGNARSQKERGKPERPPDS